MTTYAFDQLIASIGPAGNRRTVLRTVLLRHAGMGIPRHSLSGLNTWQCNPQESLSRINIG